MPFSYVVYKDRNLVISTVSGRVTWEEIKARQDQTKTDPDFNPEFNQIVDLRAVTGFDMTSEHARTLASRMIFSFRKIINYISTFTTLVPGDVIVTGTPTGAGARFDPPNWLKRGDVVEVEAHGIGILRNAVADEGPIC